MARLPQGMYWRGEVLYYRFEMNGFDYRGSLKTDDIETAKLVLAEVKKEALLNQHGVKRVPKFEWMAKKWLADTSHSKEKVSIDNAEWGLNLYLIPKLGNYTLNNITTEVVQSFLNEFRATHSEGSADALLKILNAVINYAIDAGYLMKKPYKIKRKEPNRKPKQVIQTSELKGFIDFCFETHKSKDHQTAIMIALALLTGMREGEIINARAEWLDLERATLTVHRSKTGEFRIVPLDPFMVAKLKTYLEARGIQLGLLFPGRKGHKHHGSFIYWAITRLAAKHGIPGKFGVHSCRHSYITNQHKAGATIKEIQGNVGHHRLETTAGYIQESWEGQVEAQERLSKLAGLS